MAKRTNRVAWGLAGVLAVALVGGMGLFAVWWANRPPVTVEQIENLIRIRLPSGSDKRVVARFLGSNGWHHSGCEIPNLDRWPFPGQAPGVIYGWTDEWVGWREFLRDDTAHIDITFAFDKQGKMISYQVELRHSTG